MTSIYDLLPQTVLRTTLVVLTILAAFTCWFLYAKPCIRIWKSWTYYYHSFIEHAILYLYMHTYIHHVKYKLHADWQIYHTSSSCFSSAISSRQLDLGDLFSKNLKTVCQKIIIDVTVKYKNQLKICSPGRNPQMIKTQVCISYKDWPDNVYVEGRLVHSTAVPPVDPPLGI